MENSQKVMEIEVDPVELMGQLLRKSWIVGLCGLICGAAVFLGTFFFMAPQYQSSVMFYINNDTFGKNVTTSDISASKRLAESCIAILNTRTTMDQVAGYAGTGRSYEELRQMVEAYGIGDTVLMEVVVTGTDPREAYAIAQAIAMVLPERIDAAFAGVAATVVDIPVLATEPSGPEYLKLTVIGFAAGLIVSAVIVVICKIAADIRRK